MFSEKDIYNMGINEVMYIITQLQMRCREQGNQIITKQTKIDITLKENVKLK